MLLVNRTKLAALSVMLLSIVLSGCNASAVRQHGNFLKYPGKISAFEPFLKQTGFFVSGTTPGGAAFEGKNNETGGYSADSPIKNAQAWLAGTAILFICASILLFALFRKKLLEKKHIEDLAQKYTNELDKHDEFIQMFNTTAVLLLESKAEDFPDTLTRCMEWIGQCMEIDRVYLWQNIRKDDGNLYYKQVGNWSRPGIERDAGAVVCAYQTLPRWEILLSRGESMNGPLSGFPDEERSVLEPRRIKSLLVIPIFLKNEFWGVASFYDCNRQRVFSEGEVNILRSWGLLAIGAMQRFNIALNMSAALTRLKAVTDNYKGIIWSVNNEGVITTFNGKYLKTLGLEPSFLEGKKLETARSKNRHIDIIDNVEKTFREGPQDWMGEIDGRAYHSCTTPIYDNEGNTSGIVGSTDDVTELTRLQHELKSALSATESASRAKSAFLANMSHEIRTPMNAIIGMINIGKSAATPERKNYCFEKIEEASEHLLGVINDVLDMSKIEAGKLELSPKEFNFENMLQRAVNVVNLRAEEKQQKLMVYIDGDIPKTLFLDDLRLAQVITNLLGNAIKFTPRHGAISLDARFLGEENGVCQIQISVNDTGIGISPEQQSYLFQSFSQAESSTSRKFGGTGLGLSISRSIVEMMGGKIWVESKLGAGSTFIFTVQAKKGKKKKHGLLNQDVNWRNVRILAIDDDMDVLTHLKETLRGFGASCDIAINANVAFQFINRNGGYDIYFVDWKMPGIDGIELARKLKARTAAQENSVVIMISAAEWNAIAEEAKKAGVDKFLSKPLFPSTIADIINECLGVNPGQAIAPPPDVAGVFAGRRILLVEDVEINREILMSMLNPTLLEIDCAENGVEAVRMFSKAPDKYDMIFMDVQMPKMDGYEATRRVRALEAPKAKTIPILAMTANVFREDIEKCLKAGMNSHLGKPLNFNEVYEKLRDYLPQYMAISDGLGAQTSRVHIS